MPSEGRPESIAFVGAGNMASAIIGGLLDNGYSASRIAAADPSARALETLRAMNIGKLTDNALDIVGDAQLVVLAVKPQIMANVIDGLRAGLNAGTTVMSIAAGVSVGSLENMLAAPGVAVVRCMPNTPALVRCGASGLYAPPSVSERERGYAQATMAAVGTSMWVNEESQLDAVTAVSGSGPAYFFAFMEAMIAHGEALGLSHEQAYELTLQTALGAASLASEQQVPIDTLRHNVTSPGGTTERALAAFHAGGLNALVGSAMDACHARAQAMAKEFK